jgi:hypothetical protein
MIDLTNKTTEEVNALIQKYAPVLELFARQQNHIPYLAVIIDTGVNYLKATYNEMTVDWKSWIIVLLKELYMRKSIKSEADISKEVDAFIIYHNENYENYIKDVVAVSDYDRDRGFIYLYLNKKG